MARQALTVGCLILAAGRSSRMREGNKLLADLGGKPVLAHVLDAVAAANLPALVVTGNSRAAIEALSPFPMVHAADYAEGLSRSLRTGIAAVPAEWDAALVCLGDMPGITPQLLQAVALDASPSSVVVPTFEGRRGNPVLWGRDHFGSLAALKGDIGGQPLLAALADHVTELDVADEAILRDIDTPEALALARQALA